ncbi:MAG: hypothetical protein IJ642_03345, partial [Oscillospiraceae bacterium]|nr:hypothetical protein [Oscillospiraceae bacterium]
ASGVTLESKARQGRNFVGVPWKAHPQDGQQPKRTRCESGRTRFCILCCIRLASCCDQIQHVAQSQNSVSRLVTLIGVAEAPGTYAGLSCRSV